MTNFKYKPIIREGSGFRLLRVLKGCDEDPIQCQLFESKIPSSEETSNYAALSYTWGSASKPCDIIINDSKMTVTKHVYLALRDLRFREKDRVLWVDAVSINQSDENEQGQRVRQMGSIYRNAERVIIWLGEATYDINYVMYYIKQLEEESIKHASDDQHCQKISNKQLVDIWSTIVRDLTLDQKGLLVEGFQSLLHRNWFKRVWVIQETGNARAADIVCGNKSISANIFALMPSLLGITPDLHCQSIIDIMPGPLRDSSWWAKKRDLYTMLDKFRYSEATNPKDKIYALLGISSDACNTDLLRADYGKSLQDIIFDTVSFLLNLSESDPPIYRFFDWTLPEFLENLHSLANKVLKDGHEAVVKLLLEKGADVNMVDEDGRTPLFYAVQLEYKTIIKLLLEKGADLEMKDYNGWMPLFYAVKYGRKAIVKLLLENDADLNVEDKYGQTPLSYALEYRHKATVELLLENGANLNVVDKYGRTPLSYAIKQENGSNNKATTREKH
ncbi:hypothetical protein B7463_g9427, partial [Scytalidium lignicola]